MRPSPLALAALAVALTLPAMALAQATPPFPERSSRRVGYEMDVRLDPTSHVISGTQTIRWRNDSKERVSSLWLHLYLNAFLNDRSSMALAGGERVPEDWREELLNDVDFWGYCQLREITLSDGTSLLPTLEYRHPDDENEDDRTVARVSLPRPVPPGGSIVLKTRFETRLPFARRRSGHADDYHFAAQWYPKLGVHVGTAAAPDTEGWSCHQYNRLGEFFADHGSFRVAITVPSEYGGEDGGKVGSTGRLVAELENEDGSWTYTFAQDDVHDFTWTADPDFLVEERLYRYSEQRTPAVQEEERFLRDEVGVPETELTQPDVKVRLVLQPEHAHLADRHFTSAFHALTWYGLWFGPYPYETLTLVDPQNDARATGGMEYPTLFSCGTRCLSPETRLSPEHVTVHEFGHQHFYGLLGSDEVAEAWLDEGFTSWTDDRVLQIAYGDTLRHSTFAGFQLPLRPVVALPDGTKRDEPRAWLGFGVLGRRDESLADRLFQVPELSWRTERVSDPDGYRRRHAQNLTKDRMDTMSFQVMDPASYGAIAYSKPALFLNQLERGIGRARFLRAVRTYAARYRFGHPTGDDFFRVVQEVTGEDLSDERLLLEPNVLDYAVGSVDNTKVEPLVGLLPRSGEFDLLTSDRERHGSDGGETRYRSRVVLRRLGGAVAPCRVAVTFAGALEPEIFEWDGVDRWHALEFVRTERVTAVTVDPERIHLLDPNLLNNHWRSKSESLPAFAWAARVFVSVQSAMLGTRGLS
ncbi:MAG: M1 family metallopeptidase [Acidobacteriota bacterium]